MALVVALFVVRQGWAGVAENVSQGAAVGAAPAPLVLPPGLTLQDCTRRRVRGQIRLFCSRHLGCASACRARTLHAELVAIPTGWRVILSGEALSDNGRCGCCLDQL